jgi:hypothetical protein
MLIFDFFSGTGSSTQAFVDKGHKVITFELDPYFSATENVDVFQLSAKYLLETYGRPDFVWASPPCTTFSVASIGKHWNLDKTPKTEAAGEAIKLVGHTIDLIKELDPKLGWLIENPRGMLRTLPVMKELNRYTVTYCQYGDTRMKPTDLWGYVPNWTPRPACKNGEPCHEAAPRGARTGTQGLKGAKKRSEVPYKLGEEILSML